MTSLAAIAGLIAMLALGTVACGQDALSAAAEDLATSCDSDADCSHGMTCHGIGICSVPTQLPYNVSFLFSLPYVEEVAGEQYPDVALDKGNRFSAALPDTVTVSGTIEVGESYTAEATIRAVTDGDIPGTQFSFQTDTSESSWELHLIPNKTYSIFCVFHNSQDFPTLLREEAIYIDTEDVTFVLPGADEMYTIGGTVSAGGEPVEGVKVKAVIAGTSTTVSSVAQTDEAGAFLVKLDTVGRQVTLVVEPSCDEVMFPSLNWPKLLRVDTTTPDVTDVAITVDTLPSVVTVPLSIIGEDDAPVAGATVIFSTELGGGTFIRQTVTDTDGLAELTLLAGAYDYAVIPPPSSAQAALGGTLSITAGTDLVSLYTDTRASLAGVIIDGVEGAPVADAEVAAVPAETSAMKYTSLAVQETRSYADANGSYQLNLDPGVYTLVVIPPPASGMPRKILHDITVTTDLPMDIELALPIVVHGTVTDASSQPLPGVRVEIFHAGTEAPKGPSESGDPLSFVNLLSETVTLDDGTYMAILPTE